MFNSFCLSSRKVIMQFSPDYYRSNKSLFSLFGLPDFSSFSEVKKSYRQLAMKHHPDRSKTSESLIVFKEITAAYNILKSHYSEYVSGLRRFLSSFSTRVQGAYQEDVERESYSPKKFFAKEDLSLSSLDRYLEFNISIKESVAAIRKGSYFLSASGVNIPVRASNINGEIIKVEGKGFIDGTGRKGDFYVKLSVRLPGMWRKTKGVIYGRAYCFKGFDLGKTVVVTIPELGERLQIQSKEEFRLGQKVRLRGKGLFDEKGVRGDLIVTLFNKPRPSV